MDPVNPVPLALVGGATYVARGYSGDQKGLVNMMKEAIMHDGFAFIDIIQPCVTWNRELTWAYYNKRIYSLQEEGHDTTDLSAAIMKGMESGDRIPIGVFYRAHRPDLASGLALPSDGRLRDHVTSLAEVQALIDERMV